MTCRSAFSLNVLCVNAHLTLVEALCLEPLIAYLFSEVSSSANGLAGRGDRVDESRAAGSPGPPQRGGVSAVVLAQVHGAVAAVREHDRRLADQHGHDVPWLACTHGDVIKAVIADAFGTDSFQRITADPGSVRSSATPSCPSHVNHTGASAGPGFAGRASAQVRLRRV